MNIPSYLVANWMAPPTKVSPPMVGGGAAAALGLVLALGERGVVHDAVGLVNVAVVVGVGLRGGRLALALVLALGRDRGGEGGGLGSLCGAEEEAPALGPACGGALPCEVGCGVRGGGGDVGGGGSSGGGHRGRGGGRGDAVEALLHVLLDLLIEGDGHRADKAHAVHQEGRDEGRVGHEDGLELMVADVRAEGPVPPVKDEDGYSARLDALLDVGVGNDVVLDAVCVQVEAIK